MAKILCEICGEPVHSIQAHLNEAHKDWTLGKYTETYPDADLLSQEARELILRKKKEKGEVTGEVERIDMAVGGAVSKLIPKSDSVKQPMNKVFGLGSAKAALSSSGKEIMIDVMTHAGEYADMIPDVDENYVFNINLLKDTLMGLEENMPIYLWGHAGVGKSTLYEQICARTKRPYMRVQHTANTEESHIVGQILANESGTYFEPGPLTIAMRYGLVYNADEYDFAHPSVLAVYQPVLEGKSLVIKEAPAEWRVVRPHKNFRFVATGNTNGSGDEFGLYSGTNIGNAANYSRFQITNHVQYMPKKQEIAVISMQADIDKEDAELLVSFAHKIREAFDQRQMSATIGPRELIAAARIGIRKYSWRAGVELAFINRLSNVDREVALGIAQRIFAEVTTPETEE